MTNQQKYAIKCTTEEQIKECNSNGFIAGFDNVYNLKDYTIISYDEAISLGLLGERYNQDLVDSIQIGVDMAMEGTESYSPEPVKESPSEDIVEKILNDMANNTEWQKESGYFTIEDIKIYLRKHLSSK